MAPSLLLRSNHMHVTPCSSIEATVINGPPDLNWTTSPGLNSSVMPSLLTESPELLKSFGALACLYHGTHGSLFVKAFSPRFRWETVFVRLRPPRTIKSRATDALPWSFGS